MSNSKKSRLGNQPQFVMGNCGDEPASPEFAPQAVIPQQQSPLGAGTSLRNYDGGPEPTHARGVSPQKPEIIASLDFAPMFIFRSRGRKLLTPEGLLLDTHLNARKVRINDIRTLIEKILEDPESPQGVIINDLIASLEGELLGAQRDIDTIDQISSRKSSFLGVFNIKRPNEGLSSRIQQKRAQRFPDGIPSYLDSDVDFLTMITGNHGFSETDVSNFSNTKILYILLNDIKNMLSGPSTSKSFMSTLIANHDQHRGSESGNFRDDPVSLIVPDPDTVRHPRAKVRTMINVIPRGNTPFSDASLRADYILKNPFLKRRDRDYSTLHDVEVEGGSGEVHHALYRAPLANAGAAIAASIDAITSDFAASSAMSNDQFMASRLSATGGANSIIESIFKNLPSSPGPQDSSRVDHYEVANDGSFTGAVMAQLGQKILPVFDANPQLRSRFQNIGISPAQLSSISEDILKPILETVSTEQPNVSNLQALVEQIPAKLRNSADLIEKIAAIDSPEFDPNGVLIEALRGIRDAMEGMNLTESSLDLRRLLEMNVLGEAYATTANRYKLEPRDGTHNVTTDLYIFPITFHTLNVLLVTALSKLRPGASFADLIPSSNDGDAILRGLVTRCVVQMRRTLTRCPLSTSSTGGLSQLSLGPEITTSTTTAGEVVSQPGSVDANNLAASRLLFACTQQNTIVDFKEVSRLIAAYHGNEIKVETRYGGKAFQGTRFRIDAGATAAPGLDTPSLAKLRPNYGYYAFRGEAFPSNFQQILDAGGGIFSVIIDILERLYQSSLERGPIVNSRTGRMLSSGVDPSVHVSLLVNVFSHLAYHLAGTYFSSVQTVGQTEGGSRYGKEIYAADGAIVPKLSNITKFNRSLADLQAFLDADGDVAAIPAGDSVLRNIVTSFQDHVFFKRKALTDFVDFFRSLADEIEDSSQQFVDSFSEERLSEEQADSFRRVRSSIELGVDYTQSILSKNKLEAINSKEGYRKYFDNFLTSQAEENYLYTLMHQGRFGEQVGSNLKVMCVGIPYGFTKKVLGIDPTLDPQGFNERRKVRVSVRRKDLILGGTITSGPLHYDFDLGLFFDSVQDPIVTGNQENSIIDMNDIESDVFGQINYHNSVTRRSYPDPGTYPGSLGPYQLGVSLKKLNPHTGQARIMRYSSIDPSNTARQRLFLNHVDDFLAKLYVRIAYGIDFSEDSFYIDPAVESLTSSTEEINKFSALINAHIRSLTGADLNLDDYLAGERKTRELFDRLTKDEKVKPITNIIEATVEGEPPDTNFLASEDLVAFSRMMGSNNPLIIPSTIRTRITKPKLFERVFCIFVDPDAFPIETSRNDIPNDNELVNRYVSINRRPPVYKPIGKKSGKIQASQFDAYVSLIE